MNKDFRVAITFADHPKTHKLMRRCGDKACWCLMRFWGFVAANKPDGILSNLDVDDMEIAAGWDGEPGKFVTELTNLRFLDLVDGVYHAHDWVDHNEYAAHANARKEKASAAARSRWGNTQPKQDDMLNDARSNAKSCSEQCPLPSPSPTPSPTPNPQEARGGVEGETTDPAPYESQDYAVSMDIQQIGEGYPPDKYDPGAAEDALKALVSKRQWPGLKRIQDDLAARCKCEQWTKDNGQFVPWLSNYLAKRTWMNKIPEARATPPPTSYASAESKAIDDIAEKLRRKERSHEHEFSESHEGERIGGASTPSSALPPVQAGCSARPPGR